MRVLGIDPGPQKSAYVELVCDAIGMLITKIGETQNDYLLDIVRGYVLRSVTGVIAIEKPYVGRTSGKEVGDTVFFCGRLYQMAVSLASESRVKLIPRQTILAALGATKVYNDSGDRMTNDAALRQRLNELYGDRLQIPKSSHERSALAVALAVMGGVRR